ncbi:MAG: serine/threonine-protein kinase [Deltaproteobacteria bacterium]|nr:serine/threonine-protein kinase [Deltaproteobacteria bacterium]
MTEPDPLVGKILQERYRVIERLAEGAMGVVYRGERTALQRPVAIKFLHPAVAQQDQLRKRFEIEAQAMGRLSHPNCVSVIDFGFDEVPYLVMEFAKGKTLREVLATGPIDTQRALHLGRQLLTALVHAHAQGIIHRDIKPDNLLLQQSAGLDDHLRVLDFGLAKLMDGAAGLTAGMAVGTPNYMAPEQMQEGGIDARADLYAAGVVLFEMLTGKQPFAAESMGEVLRRQLHMVAPHVRDVMPQRNFSSALDELVFRSMAKRPSERFPTAQTMLAELERVPELQGPAVAKAMVAVPSQPPPVRLPPPPSKAKAPPAPPAPPVLMETPVEVNAPPVEASTPDSADNATMQLSLHDNIAAKPPFGLKRLFVTAAGVSIVLVLWLGSRSCGSPTAPPVVARPKPPATAPATPASTAKPKTASARSTTTSPAPGRKTPAASSTSEPPKQQQRNTSTRKASSSERWGSRWKK